jgi:hypothetical protein
MALAAAGQLFDEKRPGLEYHGGARLVMSGSKKMKCVAIGCLAWFVGVVPASAAEEVSKGVARHGFLIGFTIGAGIEACPPCDAHEGFSAGLHIGMLLNDRLAVILGTSVLSYGESVHLDHYSLLTTTTSAIRALSVRYWVQTRVWVEGGLGASEMGRGLATSNVPGEFALGLTAASGVEVIQKGKFALDLQGRFWTARFDGGHYGFVSANVGLNWY